MGTTPAQDSVPVVDASGAVVAIPYIGPRKVIGNPNAHAFWSVTNELTLGTRWSLRAQVDGVNGLDVFNFDRRLLETPAFGTGAAYADEITGKVPRGYFQARRSIFEEYVENGALRQAARDRRELPARSALARHARRRHRRHAHPRRPEPHDVDVVLRDGSGNQRGRAEHPRARLRLRHHAHSAHGDGRRRAHLLTGADTIHLASCRGAGSR